MNARRMMRKSRRGFTLIELMVVIVILGVLGTSAFFVFDGAIEDSEYGRAGSEITSMAKGLEAYKLKNSSRWPDPGAAVQELKKMSGSKFNENDPWGSPYLFNYIDEDGYEIRSTGKDKAEGTADDIYWTNKDGLIKPAEDGSSGNAGDY